MLALTPIATCLVNHLSRSEIDLTGRARTIPYPRQPQGEHASTHPSHDTRTVRAGKNDAIATADTPSSPVDFHSISAIRHDPQGFDLGLADKDYLMPICIGEGRNDVRCSGHHSIMERQAQSGRTLGRELEEMKTRAGLMAQGELSQRCLALLPHQTLNHRQDDRSRRLLRADQAL